MSIKEIAKFSILFIILSLLSSCKNKRVGKFDEGEIHYKIKYNGRDKGALAIDFMPKTMVVKFSGDRTIMDITSFGNFGMVNIANTKNNTITTYINLSNMKYYYKGGNGEIPPGIDAMEDLKYINTGKTKNIFGFKSHHALATLSNTNQEFDLWYTNDIYMKQPNNFTPFSKIDGVLLSFFYKMGDMVVEFEASGAYQREVLDEEFEKSSKFLKISRKDMEKLISKMMAI